MDNSLDFLNEPFNRILIDWISFTSRIHNVQDIVDLLGIRGVPFETVVGSKGFSHRLYWNGISIHYCDSPENINYGWVWLEMSGQGCRAFETYGSGDFYTIFTEVLNHPEDCRLTRIDIAYDDSKGVLDIDQICDQTRNEHFTARAKRYEVIYSNGGNAVYFGSKASNILIRFYDKAKERGYSESDIPHWIRCELQIKDENAFGFITKLQDQTLQELYSGVLKNYLTFRDENPTDSNKRRWPESDWWAQFLNGAVPISVFCKPGVEYNLSACERYVYTQPVGSLRTLIKIFGAPHVVASIMRCDPPKNPKYQRLIEEYSLSHQNDVNFEEFLEYQSSDVELLDSLDIAIEEIYVAQAARAHDRDKSVAIERIERDTKRYQMSLYNDHFE